MSKKFLILYFSPECKLEAIKCEKVFRAIMRKFRKSALFSYVQVDTSPSLRDKMKEILLREISRCDAVLLSSSKEDCVQEAELTGDILKVFATAHFSTGSVLCYPYSDNKTINENGCIVEKQIYCQADIQKAAALAASLAKSRKHSLTVCTRTESSADRLLLEECEYALSKDMHIQTEHITPDKMISLCARSIPPFDVILTTELWAKIIEMHLCGYKREPSGYVINHTEYCRIYSRRNLPSTGTGNTAAASLLLAFSAILENELQMKGAADWLRRGVSLAFEEHGYAPADEFLERVIFETDKPVRQRSTT